MAASHSVSKTVQTEISSIQTRLEDGRAICIRRLDGNDEQGLREGIARMSPRSRYLRFFSGAESPPDAVIAKLLDADGHDHIAWAAIDTSTAVETGIGVVHAIREGTEAAIAEYAIAVVDAYQGLGIGRLLTATVLLDASDESMREFRVHTLSENQRVIAFVGSLGARFQGMDGITADYTLDVAEATTRLRSASEPAGLRDVFRAFDGARAITPPSGTPPAS